MPDKAQTETLNIQGHEVKVHWKSPRFGEWLAWCYVPSSSMRHNEGAGFEARAGTPEAAREAVVQKVKEHLSE